MSAVVPELHDATYGDRWKVMRRTDGRFVVVDLTAPMGSAVVGSVWPTERGARQAAEAISKTFSRRRP